VSHATRWLGLVGLLLVPGACKPLEKPGAPGQGGALPEEALRSTDVVPLAWGKLVSVTYVPSVDASFLWFQDDSGAVRAVRFNNTTQRLWPQARLVRRH
jgi:hypothetical protein